ncbi:cation acetate symporter [Paenactinomyces guangxiensis]|uniref:Cation/acetate symporter ActP n=1 Tax=Paenactinomyces guangxiensis TaxID=1490290 RepID=A0A7W1WPF1_9BACL|nr:sodium/solute symporter [Paenactinomyces guangxiensis]MBA4493615.1 cation/acetate symporter ActP [Paenactinomyces guangxiensis]MBH8590902.1 cation/acetate symporter ActP [Paenactinomyces guangxiensis]
MNTSAFTLFTIIVALTLFITYWAAKRTQTTTDFYAAGRSITGWQNGIAIAGDYMSAASFLGIAGLIALGGFDGFLYSVGWLVAYLVVLIIVAEPLRNSGRYTMADMLAYRMKAKPVRSAAALSTLAISTFYMIAQLVGAGGIIKLLLDLNYEISIIIIGVLMILYVVFGGMLATTWVQIVKAVLLMAGTILLSLLVLAKFDFSMVQMFDQVSAKLGQKFLEPGLLYKNPLENISLGLALLAGTAGLPHILIRFYTVPTAKEARTSVVWAMFIIGSFYIMTTFLGFGSALLVGKENITAADQAGNMAAPLLAEALGGNFFLAFISAVAFATILAVVAGLVISAAGAFAHDFYSNVIRGGNATDQEQMRVAKWASVAVGIVSIILALLCKDQNVAFLVSLAFAVAASANLPVIIFSLFWKRFNSTGAVTGILTGLISAILFVLISPNIMEPETAVFPLKNPAIVSVPLGFLGAFLGTFFSREPEAEQKFTELYVRSNTGIGAE